MQEFVAVVADVHVLAALVQDVGVFVLADDAVLRLEDFFELLGV